MWDETHTHTNTRTPGAAFVRQQVYISMWDYTNVYHETSPPLSLRWETSASTPTYRQQRSANIATLRQKWKGMHLFWNLGNYWGSFCSGWIFLLYIYWCRKNKLLHLMLIKDSWKNYKPGPQTAPFGSLEAFFSTFVLLTPYMRALRMWKPAGFHSANLIIDHLHKWETTWLQLTAI